MARLALIGTLAFTLLVSDSPALRHAGVAEKRAALRLPFVPGATRDELERWQSRLGSSRTYVLTARTVGLLRFRVATFADVRAAFGAPTRSWRALSDGFLNAPVGLFAKAGVKVSGYRCRSVGRRDCWTFFAFERGRLVGLWSESPTFRTAGGTRVGTSLRQARRNDAGEWNGTQVQISALRYRSRYGGQEHVDFKAYIDRDSLIVKAFFVSRSPAVGDGS